MFGLLSLLISRILGLAVSREREYPAHASAVELTRNPDALISALSKIEADGLPTSNIVRGLPIRVARMKSLCAVWAALVRLFDSMSEMTYINT